MSDSLPEAAGSTPRPSYRPPIGLPLRREDRRIGIAASILFHALLVLLIVAPFVAGKVVEAAMESAGGPGPAGGGGGGRGGTGGMSDLIKERLRYIQVAPAPATPPDPLTPPDDEVVKPEEPVPPLTPPALEPQLSVPAPVEPAVDLHLTSGAGGGTGNDGTEGTGPGTGGGVGSGIGTGRGSGIGPGTGGGNGSIYTPTPIQLFLPPMPPPAKIRPYRLIAVFDIDETGRILDVDFNPSRDSGYNRKLKDVLWQMRFKPAVTTDGTPVRAKYQMTIEI